MPLSTIDKLHEIRKAQIAKHGYGSLGYGDLLTAVGLTVVSTDDFGYYQGDYLFHVTDVEGRHGLLIQGYGSCSGCDALEAAQPWQNDGDLTDVAVLADGMVMNVVWENENGLLAAFEDKLSTEETASWWRYSDAELLARAREIAREVDAA
jgi:hypothetical protein